eukprot:TCALIF_02501-PA protein Name:"Similar to Gaa Lysosomal alpha-glucosidase (Rattus norvegicus)" AED:0.10 eAED:0.10 QI:0/0.75/0.55/0.88/0.75/0.77/9/17/845
MSASFYAVSRLPVESEKGMKAFCGVIWVVTLALSKAQSLTDSDRVDCHPDPNVTQARCEQRGCIFEPPLGSGRAPVCYLPPFYGYRLQGDEVLPTDLGFEAILERNLAESSYFGQDFSLVRFEVEFQTESRLRVKLSPLSAERYEVPIPIERDSNRPQSTLYDVQFSYEPVFSFQVIRKSTGTILFDSSYGGLTLSDQFLQIASRLPSENVYGLGEHEQPSFKHDLNWKTWTMFARDVSPNPELNLYGTHPYYTVLENDGNAHSVLFKNSNAADVTLTPKPGLVYRTIGGVLDLYFFLGPTPENVVQQYTGALGRHQVPAYWSLGFHICRWGYESTQDLREVYQRTLAAEIPLDGQWSDIDIMDRKVDFTYDKERFGDLPDFIQDVHNDGRRFVAILDPGIPTGESDYPAFEEGSTLDVWVKEAQTGLPIQGMVWPDSPVYYPDFTSPITRDWWVKWIKAWRQEVPWDGLWIDMNEPANFEQGSLNGCEENMWNNPPYVPGANASFGLITKTLCMDAQHAGGSHYDTHSMYGWWEAVASFQAVQEATDQRSLVLSRSTFIGGAKYASHWLGDNFAEWDNLKYSIIGILQFNQFGFPLVGADICGFNGDYDPEMCARWHQLGAFYPFARNHNSIGNVDQDPDVTTWTIDEQFLWGNALLVSPVLRPGEVSVSAYLPEARWFDFYTTEESDVRGNFSNLDAPIEKLPLHIRGGTIIPTQASALSTEMARKNDLHLLVSLDENQEAEGVLYWDDGQSLDPSWAKHAKVAFTYSNNQLNGTVVKNDHSALNDLQIGKVSFYGLPTIIARIRFPEESRCDWNQTFAFTQVECSEKINPAADWSMELFFYC